MSTLVAPRSRAAARVNRISVDLDRSSGYLLGKVYWNDVSRVVSVSSICVIWLFPLHFTSVKRYGIIRNIFTKWCFDP